MKVPRFLNLNTGDLGRGLPLFAYLFLIISSYMMGKVARDALFLDRFAAVRLPYADIAIALLVGFVIALYIRAGRLLNVRNLLAGSLVFYSVNVIALWWLVHSYQWPWLFPVLYVWVGIFGVLAPTQVWTLANFVWTTREAKRLFGLLGSGGIAGGIFGGFFSTWVASNFETESLLLIMAVFLLGCAGLVFVIWRQKENAGTVAETDTTDGAPQDLWGSFRLVRQSAHLKTIAILICLSSVVTTTAAWQFKALAQGALVEKNAMAAYFGTFYFYTGILSLIAQLLFTSRLLRRFGVGVALLILPLIMVGGSVAVLAFGTLFAATFLSGSDKVMRYSIDTSAVQLLYLPVSAKIKLQVKSFIDTVIWRLGDGLSGFTLLIFATTLQFTPSQISWVSLVLLSGWLTAAVVARRQYVRTLNDNIRQCRLSPQASAVPTLDRLTSTVITERLKSPDPNEIMYALDLFEMGQRQNAYSAIRNLLDHPSPHIRTKAISVFTNAGDKTARDQVAALLRDENLEVRTEALRYLTRHDNLDPLSHIEELSDFTDFSVRSATISFLAREGEAQNLEAARFFLDTMVRASGKNSQPERLEAARLIASLPDHFEAQLAVLLADPDAEVLRHAVRAVGALNKRWFVPAVIQRLSDPNISSDAADALGLFGGSIVGTLRDHLNDPHEPIEIRREIPQVLWRIGTTEAASVLIENVLQGDTVLRYRIISAINKLHELHRNVPIDREMIETVMVAEIMGHYRSYQILGNLTGTSGDLLRESMDRELERIFRLMKMLFPTIDFQNAYHGVQSKDASTHANALEFLDNILNAPLRALLIPVIDSEVSIEERMRLADRLLGARVSSHEEAVAVLLNSEDPWLRSCAVHAMSRVKQQGSGA